jgi:predicted DNA-binding transcriptional regulator AlpA
MKDVDIQIAPLLLDAAAAAKMIGVSRAHLYGLHSSRRLGPMPVRLGKRTLWRRDELETWVARDCPSRQQWQSMKDGN